MQDTDKAILTYGQLSDLVERIEQIPPLSGEGAPTTLTPAFYLGQRYINTTTGDEYYCSNIDYESDENSLPTFEWKPVDTSASYTGGDGIDISAQNVISATNTGKARELTTADYNWPTNSPDGIALWLLSPGLYQTSTEKVYFNTSDSAQTGSYQYLIGLSNNDTVARIYQPVGRQLSATTINTGAKFADNQTLLMQSQIIDNLISAVASKPLSANQGKVLNDKIEGRIIQNAGAPTTATVGTVGMILEDTTNGKLYICTAVDTSVTPNTYTWVEVGAGGGNEAATVLTTDDYNWPVDNPTTINLALLPQGLYTGETGVAYCIGNNVISNFQKGQLIYVVPFSTQRYIVFYPTGLRGSLDDTTPTDGKIYRTGADGNSVFETNKILYQSSLVNTLTSTSSGYALDARQGKVLKDLADSLAIRGTGAPTTATVGQVGTLYEDTTNGDLYICTDATNPYVWEEVGGGPTVVQTTGTSTTDVMSQNATTSMVYYGNNSEKIQITGGYGGFRNNNAKGLVLGYSATIRGSYDGTSVVIGNGATDSTSDTYTGGTGATIVGSGARCNYQIQNNITAIGRGAAVSSASGVALGAFASVGQNSKYAIALGSGSSATVQGQFDVSTGAQTTSGYNNSNYRLLTGLYDGQSAHDAATVGQITPLSDSSAPTTATVGRLGQIFVDSTNTDAYMCVAVDDVTPSYTWKKITA